MTEARQSLQGLLRGVWQPAQLGNHEIDDVVGVALGADRSEIPTPAATIGIKGDELAGDQLLQELE